MKPEPTMTITLATYRRLMAVVEAIDSCKPKFWGDPGAKEQDYDEVELTAQEWKRVTDARAVLEADG